MISRLTLPFASSSSAAKFGLMATALMLAPAAWSSSHREAPSIGMNPTVDATDLYMFRSYETEGFATSRLRRQGAIVR